MSIPSGMNDSNNKNKRTKPTAAIPMAGAIVTGAALLLSGLSLISNNNYQPAIAQAAEYYRRGRWWRCCHD